MRVSDIVRVKWFVTNIDPPIVAGFYIVRVPGIVRVNFCDTYPHYIGPPTAVAFADPTNENCDGCCAGSTHVTERVRDRPGAPGRPGDLVVLRECNYNRVGSGVQISRGWDLRVYLQNTKSKESSAESVGAWVGAIRCESTREEWADVLSR